MFLTFGSMKYTIIATLLLAATTLTAQGGMKPEATEFYTPVPPKVETPEVTVAPPGDAIVLLGAGNEAAEWVGTKSGEAIGWKVENGVMTVTPGAGNIRTRRDFGDVQLHIEWRSPNEPGKQGQGRGNSGIFFQGRYEVQVLESHGSDTYTNGQAGSIYKQSPPLVNATRPMGEWNAYDILFRAPRFDANGMVVSPAAVTVLHNGVVVQNHFELRGPTVYTGIPNYTAHGKGPFILQDHSNEVSYRNIWVREL